MLRSCVRTRTISFLICTDEEHAAPNINTENYEWQHIKTWQPFLHCYCDYCIGKYKKKENMLWKLHTECCPATVFQLVIKASKLSSQLVFHLPFPL